MLLALDDFIFELNTLPFKQRQQSRSYRWAQQLPVASKPIYQYMGQGERTMVLSGVLYPEITGGAVSLNQLNALAALGEPLMMVDGNGIIHGDWLIESINETHSELFDDGTAQKIEFEISLIYENEGQTAWAGGDESNAGNIA